MPIETQNNALVREGAQISPAQAFVDVLQAQLDTGTTVGLLRFDAVHMATFDAGDYLTALLDAVFAKEASLSVRFDNNALDQHGVNLVISTVWSWAQGDHEGYSGGVVSVAGGTNAVPDGDVATLITDLQGWGWTVNHN